MKEYTPNSNTSSMIDRAFMSHPDDADQMPRFDQIKERIQQTARYIARMTPDSEEQKMVVKCLREALFWATEAIRKNE